MVTRPRSASFSDEAATGLDELARRLRHRQLQEGVAAALLYPLGGRLFHGELGTAKGSLVITRLVR